MNGFPPGLARLQGLLRQTLQAYEQVQPRFPALLGLGNDIVKVSDKPGFVWVRLGAEGEDGVTMAWNQKVSLRDGLAITVGYRPEQPALFQVLCQREVYAGTDATPIPEVVAHASTHQWADPDGGDDPVFVQLRQWMPFRVGATGIGLEINVQPGIIWRGGWVWVAMQELDLLPYKPVGYFARYCLVVLDQDGVAKAYPGEVVTPPENLTLASCPGCGLNEMPLAAVAIYGVQSTIRDSSLQYDIRDLRWPQVTIMNAQPMLDAVAALANEFDLAETQLVRRSEGQGRAIIAASENLDDDLTLGLIFGRFTALQLAIVAGDDPDIGLTFGLIFRRLAALETAIVAVDSALDLGLSGHITVNR